MLARSEVVVDADLSAVDVQRSGLDARRELVREERLSAEAAIEIFALERPVRQEHPFDARARGPAGQGLAVADADTERAGAKLGVGDGQTGGAVEQDLIDGDTEAAAHGRQRIELRADGDAADGDAVVDVSERAIAFDTGDELAELPVVADRSAAEATLQRERIAAVLFAIAAHGANVEPGPVGRGADDGGRL